MNRPLLVLLLAVILGATGWLLLRDPGGSGAGTRAGDGAAAERAPEAGMLERGGDGSEADAATDADAGQEIAREEQRGEEVEATAPDDAAQLLRVRTEDAEGEPVPHARLHVLHVPPDRREDWRRWHEEEPDREIILRARGRELRSDAEGYAEVAVAEDFVALVARHDDLYGERDLWFRRVEDAEEISVVLRPDREIHVRVVDEAGAPVADLPVGFAQLGDDWSHFLQRRKTDADGRTRFPHVQESFATGRRRDRELAVLLAVPLEEPVMHVVDPDAPPGDVVELVLPATGRVAVHVRDFDGEPAEDGTVVRLQRKQDAPPRWYGADDYWPRPSQGDHEGRTEDGVALFPRVGLGVELEAAALLDTSGRWFKTEGPGPRMPGETAVLHVRQDVLRPVIVLALQAPDGSPLADTRVQAELELKSHEGRSRSTRRSSATTDAEGVLRFPVGRDSLAGHDSVHLTVRREAEGGAPTLTGDLSVPVGLGGGEQDLGVLRLSAAALLASGVVQGEDGSPIPDARVWLEYAEASENRPQNVRWRRAGLSRYVTTDEDGAFTLYGTVPSPTIRLRAHHEDHLPAMQEAVAGSAGIRVVMRQGRRLAGRLLLDDDVPGNDLRLVFAPLPPEDAEERQRWRWEHPRTRVDTDGEFQFQALPPDADGHLFVVQDDVIWPLARLHDVRPWPPGGLRDPRLDPWDLRGTVRAADVTVRLRSGGEPESLRFALVPAGAQDAVAWEGARGGEIVLLLGEGAQPDLLVHAKGTRVARAARIAGDREVVLDDGIPVRLQLQPVPDRGGTLTFAAHLRAPAGAPMPRSVVPFDESGALLARLPRPGEYRVSIIVEWEREEGGTTGRRLPLADGRDQLVIEVSDGVAVQSFPVAYDVDRFAELSPQ